MHYSIEKLIARQQVIDVLNQLFIQADARNWLVFQKCFTDSVLVELISASDVETNTFSPAEIADAWEKAFNGAAKLHHQVSNFVVDVHGADMANAECYCTSYHYFPDNAENPVRTFVGNFEFELERGDDQMWRICTLWSTRKFEV